MSQVFISYNSSDYDFAKSFYSLLRMQKVEAWFAPAKIKPGENFAEKIGMEIDDEDSIEERAGELSRASLFLLILSKGAMQSSWVKKELKLAIKKHKRILVARVDHEALTEEFEYLLADTQITDCYHMNQNAVSMIVGMIRQLIGADPVIQEDRKRFSEQELHIHRITCGDPYYEEPETLVVRLSGHEFFLSPPQRFLAGADEALTTWCKANNFADMDNVFGSTVENYVEMIPIPDLAERIEASREKIFHQFLNKENGCYFNNKKFGVEDINPFGRTTDIKESAKLEMQMFVTDYFTHRVMKDVCKTLVSEQNRFIREIDYSRIGTNRIFFTSLGINLVLAEDMLHEDRGVLITSRSTNSAETYQQHRWSLSVIEGVSVSDYDEYQDIVSLVLSAERGLIEELKVTKEYYQLNTLRFYELFVNRDNLEMGVTCSVELKKDFRLQTDILPLHGKDQELEIADKRVIKVSDLETFIRINQNDMLPQAMYTLCAYLENNGTLMIDRHQVSVLKKQSFLCSKRGLHEACGDYLVDEKNYIAVIDGATPKGQRLWGGVKGDIFVSGLLGEAIRSLPPMIDAKSAIEVLNHSVEKQYKRFGIDFKSLEPEEQLQASVVIFSVARKEVWSFGDCLIRINKHDYRNIKSGDRMLSDLRAFCIEAAELQHASITNDEEGDFGRSQILPFLKQFTMFANSKKSFGYDVINGGEIFKERVKVYQVKPGDHVVLASDGYPKLFDTLEETEEYLRKCLEEDPACIYKLRGTKGVKKGDMSYDDRCFVGFTVEP